MIRVNSIKFQNSGFERLPDNRIERTHKLKENLKKKAAKLLKINVTDIGEVIIRKHSIDARKKPEIFDLYSVDITLATKGMSEEKIVKKSGCKNAQIVSKKGYRFPVNRKEDQPLKRLTGKAFFRPIVIGAGPGGLFCAYQLAMAGYCPIVLERGMDVDKRLAAVEGFWNGGALNPKGNVQFGEGGAGTFSDGKLNTMVKDKEGRGYHCLEIFVDNGAYEEILYESKPHIGTDVLRDVVKNMRKQIIRCGGEFHFETQVTELLLEESNGKKKIKGVICDDGRKFLAEVVVLAIGHSARDTFKMLKESGINMEPKPFAVGLRVEHPQKLINNSQYGIEESTSLPPSPYKVTAQSSSGHGVYSFCMCPGGYVVNASSEEKRIAVNGMSYSGRDGKNANSAIVVTVDTKDFGGSDVLSGVEFQRRLEESAYEIGQGKIPVEYFDDYRAGIDCLKSNKSDDEVLADIEKHSASNRNTPTIKGDYNYAPLHRLLPIEIGSSIVEGMEHFGRMIKGFDSDEAVFSGVESRTSSPVRINRDEALEAIDIEGLYPCGEGAGYAGGITSAAMDGMKVAEQVAIHYYSAKDQIRKEMAEKRTSLSVDEKKKLDTELFNRVISSDYYKNAEDILVFSSTDEETDTKRIIEKALSDGKRLYCPKITVKTQRAMEFVKISSMDDFTEETYGISEPAYKKELVYSKASASGLLLLPGLCFDNKGNRIGYGGGFYDRFQKRFFKEIQDGIINSIALAYSFQVESNDLSSFMNEDDIKVKAIITDKETITCN